MVYALILIRNSSIKKIRVDNIPVPGLAKVRKNRCRRVPQRIRNSLKKCVIFKTGTEGQEGDEIKTQSNRHSIIE